MNRRYIALPMVLLVLSLASGCGTIKAYEGPTLPESQVAVLSAACCLLQATQGSFCIQKIDGKPIEQPCFIGGHMGYKFELPPGQHRVSVEFTSGGPWVTPGPPLYSLAVDLALPYRPYTHTERVLTFEAEAGHTYDIGPFWIKDTTPGEVVFDRDKFLAEKERKLLVDAEKGDPDAQYEFYKFNLLNMPGAPDQESLRWLCLAANQGYAPAQEEFGDLHAGVYGGDWSDAGFAEPDRVRAYVWYSLAASSGFRRARFSRNTLANQMTPEQIAEAERLAAEWKPGDCGAPPKSASAH